MVDSMVSGYVMSITGTQIQVNWELVMVIVCV